MSGSAVPAVPGVPSVPEADQGQRLLDLAQTPADYVEVLRYAEAARVYAKQAKLGPYEIDKASRLAAKALLELAGAINDGQAAGEIRRQGKHGKAQGLSLSELDVHDEHLKAGRDLLDAFRDINAIDAWQSNRDGGLADGRAEIIAAARSLLTGIDPQHGDDWYTPRWLFKQLDLTFDLDVCAPSDPAMRSVPADRYYTAADDGLAQPWDGLVWCNPPYSTPGEWALRWLEHGNGLLLTHIPANAAWAVHVWRGANAAIWLQAMHFERPNGQTYRPGYALQLAAIGDQAEAALARIDAPKSGAIWRRDRGATS